MTKEEFVVRLEAAAAVTQPLPVTTSLLRQLSDALRKGEPPWWPGVQKAWDKREFAPWEHPWAMFLACIHFEVLSDERSPLVPYFPSCDGADEGVPPKAFEKFMAQLPPSFFANLASGQVRLYDKALAPLWIGSAALFFQRRKLPFHLVEIDAGAGLNLAADKLFAQERCTSDLVAARIGLDSRPLSLQELDDRRWLTALFLPDQMGLIAKLDQAMEKVRKLQRRDADFIQLFHCPAEAAPEFIAKNVPAGGDGTGLLLLNVGTTGRMKDAEYAAYVAGMTRTMRPWRDRALWVEVETPRGVLFPAEYQMRVHRLVEGELRQHLMASVDFVDKEVVYDLMESAKFLA